MEWCIPIQTFQVENVQLGNLSRGLKSILPLAYKDSDFQFPALSILLPNLTIKSYDVATGRLILSLAAESGPVATQTLYKLQTLQDMVLNAVALNYRAWFPSAQKRPQDLRQGFQPMIQNHELHLYCPIYETMAQPIPLFAGGGWVQGKPKPGSLKPGTRVRIAFRLYGISFHTAAQRASGQQEWSGKFRLQHKIIGVLVGG
jgi:hypothetical protein